MAASIYPRHSRDVQDAFHTKGGQVMVAAHLNSGTLTLNRPGPSPPPVAATPQPRVLTAGRVQVKIPLNPAEVVAVLQRVASVDARIHMTIRATGEISDSRSTTVFRLRTTIAPKGIRKALAVLQELGTEGVIVYIQGKLGSRGDEILDAGLVAQPKIPKAPM